MEDKPQFTRWRALSDPISPLDPIQQDAPRYEAGKLPVGFILLLWNKKENRLSGPVRFINPESAEKYVNEHNPDEYIVIPKPNS